MQGLTIYKSSAGSGKTFTLVKEYLKLVLKNPAQQPNILAITFTNKATGEMKHRIIHSLAQLAENKNSTLKELLENEIPGIDIQKTAAIVIEKILHDYTSFAVCTIDSFFHRIIKSFARELHLPLQFEIELDTDFVIDQVIENLLQDLNTKHDLADWLRNFLMEKLSEDKGWKIEKEIAEIAKELFKENGIPPSLLPDREKIAAFRKKMIQQKCEYEEGIRELAMNAMDIVRANGFTVDDFSHKSTGPAGYLAKLLHDPAQCTMNSYVLKALYDPAAWAPKSSAFHYQISQLAENYLIPVLTEIKQFTDKRYEHYCTATEAIRYLYLIGILSDLNEYIKKYRDEKNVVFIADMPRLLQAGINESDTPFVYEKTGTVFKHFLIDEFQDTSDYQWNNILPLVKNSLAGNYFTLVVGDVKQSIYRWRGGNMELLMKNLKDHLKHFSGMTKEVTLSTNYRSKKNIVEFNNDFFTTATDILKPVTDYGDESLIDLAYKQQELKQLVVEKNNSGGYVEILFADPDAEAKHGDDEIKWKDIALQKMLDVINRNVQDGYHLKDIAILVRRNTEGNEIANYLFDNGIEKVISPDSLLITSSPGIRLLISMLRYISNNKNEVARSHVLYYLSKHNIINNHLPLHDFFVNTDQSKIRSEHLLNELESLESFPLYEVAEKLIRKFGFDINPDAYLQRFLDLILDFSVKNGSDINSFLQWFDENDQREKTSLVVPENEDAITIMTIHKAKGLQFPVVIVPFAEWELTPHKNSLLWKQGFDDDLPILAIKATKELLNTEFKSDYLRECALSYLDNLNLLYVTFTRPEERLFVISCLPKKMENITRISQLIYSFVFNRSEFDKLNNIFKIGREEESITSNKEYNESVTLSAFISSEWNNKLKIKIKKRKKLEKSTDMRKTFFGSLIHNALAELKTREDLPAVIEKLTEEGQCDAIAIEELKNSIGRFMASEVVSDWFSGDWEVINERELLLPGGTVLRPDRVMVKDNKAMIVDYKTGKKDKAHHLQLNEYGNSLAAAGYSEVKKYILYLQENELVEIN